MNFAAQWDPRSRVEDPIMYKMFQPIEIYLRLNKNCLKKS